MNLIHIRFTILFAIAGLNAVFALFVWLKGRGKEAYHLVWLSIFVAIFSFSWGAVYSLPNTLFWVKMTWEGAVVVAANMIFTYVYTGKIKFFKLKIIIWYGVAAIILAVSLATPYIIASISNVYPYIIAETAGPLNQLARMFAVFGLLLSMYYSIVAFHHSSGLKRIQLKYLTIGFLIFVSGSLLFDGILPLFLPQFFFFLDAPVYFSVIWLGLATYIIIKKEIFNIKIILTELLVSLIGLLLFIQIFFATDVLTQIVESVIFILFCLIGYLLIRATHRNIDKEHEAEKLAADISYLNNTLKDKVRDKTYELQKNVAELKKSKVTLTKTLVKVEQARGEMETERNKTMTIITNFTDGLLVFDNEHILTLFNPRAEIFFGVSIAKIIGKNWNELKKMSFFTLLFNILGDDDLIVSRKELEISDFTLETSSIPLTAEGERIGTLVILHDVTREKRIEKTKTEFVSIAAHQLRTPLSGVKWALSLILDGELGKITDEQKSFLKKSYNSNERMIILVNDLLDVARIEEGKYSYKMVPTHLDVLVKNATDIYKESAIRNNITIRQILPTHSSPEVMVDIEKITIAMQNFIENAIKYTLPGGHVTISLTYDIHSIEFSVADTGVGISPKQQDRLFTKFFRADNAILMETDGTGLGLFITKNIIKAHKGKIWFESKVNKGSTFSFSLPIKQ